MNHNKKKSFAVVMMRLLPSAILLVLAVSTITRDAPTPNVPLAAVHATLFPISCKDVCEENVNQCSFPRCTDVTVSQLPPWTR